MPAKSYGSTASVWANSPLNTITATVPANESWTVQSVLGTFTSNATVGNRIVQCNIKDQTGATVLTCTHSTVTQAASLANKYTVFSGSVDAGTQQPFPIKFPSGFTMGPGWSINMTDSANIASAGDAWSAYSLTVFVN